MIFEFSMNDTYDNYIFRQEYLNELWEAPTERDEAITKAALEYHINCEKYDRLICGASGRPVEPWQMSAVNRNANRFLKQLVGELTGWSISTKEILTEIQKLSRFEFEDWEEMYKKYEPRN